MEIEKYRVAEVIIYPCNMIPDWKEKFEDLIQLPFVAALHDRDNTETHLHCILCRGNGPATLNWFIKWVNKRLSNPDKIHIDKDGVIHKAKCCSTAEPIITNFRKAYDYLYHGGVTLEKCKEEGKFLYSQSILFSGNNFELARYLSMDEYDKTFVCDAICREIVERNFTNLRQVYDFCVSSGNDYIRMFQSKSALFDRLCGGNYKDVKKNQDEEERNVKLEYQRLKLKKLHDEINF